MRILQLCKKFPYPLKDGESIAVTFLSKALRDLGCEITLLCMNTTKHYMDLGKLPSNFDHYKAIHTTPLDNAIKPAEALKNLFSDSSYHVDRFISEPFRQKLIEVLREGEFDVVQLETLFLTPYVETIKAHSDAQIVMRAHNVEHEIWERISNNTSFLPKKWYLSYLTRKLRDYEIKHLNDYDYLVALTDRDLKRFKRLGYRNGAMASPIGIDARHYTRISPARQTADKLTLCFIGSLDWMPNVEGLNWFLSKVWPRLHKLYPDAELHVAGRNTPPAILNLRKPGVTVHGEVPNASEFISRYSAMVVPLFSGSGMRVKILEGMALGKPIITTTLGMEGIDAVDREHILVADSADAFVDLIGVLKTDRAILEKVGQNARTFVEKKYNSHAIAQQLFEIYTGLAVGDHVH